jgi:hypothetical protein
MFTGVNDIEKDSEEYNNTLNLFEEKKWEKV